MCLLRVYSWTFIPVPSNTGKSMSKVAESCFKIVLVLFVVDKTEHQKVWQQFALSTLSCSNICDSNGF